MATTYGSPAGDITATVTAVDAGTDPNRPTVTVHFTGGGEPDETHTFTRRPCSIVWATSGGWGFEAFGQLFTLLNAALADAQAAR